MTTRPKRSLALAGLAATALLLSACGSSSDDAADTTAAAADTTAAVADTDAADTAVATTEAPDTTVAATDVAVDTTLPATDSSAGATGGGSTADVEMVEWAINAPASLTAGPVTMNVTNTGNFKHELLVIQGDSYESLPLAANGSVETDQLPAGALIGEADDIEPGATATLSVDLPAGHYVLLCNITGGGSSHAARGQVTELDAA